MLIRGLKLDDFIEPQLVVRDFFSVSLLIMCDHSLFYKRGPQRQNTDMLCANFNGFSKLLYPELWWVSLWCGQTKHLVSPLLGALRSLDHCLRLISNHLWDRALQPVWSKWCQFIQGTWFFSFPQVHPNQVSFVNAPFSCRCCTNALDEMLRNI